MEVGIEVYKNNSYCKECKGLCCKEMGCHLSPSDIKSDSITYEVLKELLDTGKYSIDWWECYTNKDDKYVDRGYFIRMRNLNSKVIDPSWGGQCALYDEAIGCPLSFEDRPKGARMLIAKTKSDDDCKSHYTKKDTADDWNAYHTILQELVDHYTKKEKEEEE